MTVIKLRKQHLTRHLFTLLTMFLVLSAGGAAFATPTRNSQKSYSNPAEAAKALFTAVKKNDDKTLAGILGPGAEQLITSGDPVADRLSRERFICLYEEKNRLELISRGKAILSIGNADFPFPLPLIKKKGAWVFDSKAGKKEILSRRIGRNELAIMDVLHAYLDAQREYSLKDHDGNGILEFARRLNSTPGKQDGLYWEVKEGEETSPFGPLAAQADCQGYGKQFRAAEPEPFHGYYFKVLTEQGSNAVGGAFDYVVNGKMVLGFALVAYPALYRSSGVMTFIVNQSGVIYQKDLGKNSTRLATEMKSFDPDSSWEKVE